MCQYANTLVRLFGKITNSKAGPGKYKTSCHARKKGSTNMDAYHKDTVTALNRLLGAKSETIFWSTEKSRRVMSYKLWNKI